MASRRWNPTIRSARQADCRGRNAASLARRWWPAACGSGLSSENAFSHVRRAYPTIPLWLRSRPVRWPSFLRRWLVCGGSLCISSILFTRCGTTGLVTLALAVPTPVSGQSSSSNPRPDAPTGTVQSSTTQRSTDQADLNAAWLGTVRDVEVNRARATGRTPPGLVSPGALRRGCGSRQMPFVSHRRACPVSMAWMP
jgi:hypothetical protein